MATKVQKNIFDSNNENQNIPSAEVINALKTEMTDAATLKLINTVKALEQYYGLEITDLINNIDDFINHFHTNELMKRDIKERIDYYEKNGSYGDVNRLLSCIKEECRTYELDSEALDTELFSMRTLKKFISDLAVVFALNQPLRDRKINETTTQNS